MRTGTYPGLHPWLRAITRAAAAPLISMVISACGAGGVGLFSSLSDVQGEALERDGMAFPTALDAEDAYVAISPDGRRIATASGTISGNDGGSVEALGRQHR